MKDFNLRKPLALVAMSATLFGASIAMAQAPEPAGPPQQSTAEPSATVAPATAIDEQKIDKFADAYVAVQTIQQKATDKLDKAGADPQQQQQEQAKVESEMIAAVEQTGLKLDEFNGIVQTMTADAGLREKVIAKIRERTGG